MKRFLIFIIQTVALSVVLLFSQERISVLDDQLVFYIPDGVITFKGAGNFASYEEYKKYYANYKMSIYLIVFDASYFSKNNQGLSSGMANLVKSNKMKQKDFLSLLNTNKDIPAFFAERADTVIDSHAFYKYKGITVGELYGSAGEDQDRVPAPDDYRYSIRLVIGDNIVGITIRLHDENITLPKQMPDYFIYENQSYKNYIWRDSRVSRNTFYKKLNSDDYKKLPVEFHRLREARDMILNTMVIKGYEKDEYYKTETALRLRSNAGTSSDVIITIPKDYRVKLLEEGNVQIIDGIAAKWVKVETDDGKQGWCFSGYLKQ